MASNYTEHYGLCQWEETDQVMREEFNENNAKIDAALSAMRTVSSCVTGNYIGNDGDVHVELGFRPSFLFIIPSNRTGSYTSDIMGLWGFSGVMVELTRYDSIEIFSKCEFTDTGFTVAQSNMTAPQITFLYAAFY